MPKRSKYTKELLLPLVENSTSIAQLLSKLGLKATGGNYRNIRLHLNRHKINTSHFTGKAWSKGKTKETDKNVKRISMLMTTPDNEVFKEDSGYPAGKLYKRLIALGWEVKCHNEKCGLTEWLGDSIRLHVDHINGNSTDHRLENLRFLCPNCHQQTETWGNKRY